jgi:hypothetical protein
MPFTYNDFRENVEWRTLWAQFLNSDVGMVLIRMMRQKYRPTDVLTNLDALASARTLSFFDGAHTCLDDLENLAMPPGFDQKDIESTFRAPDTDHENMPSPEEMRPRVVVPTHLMPSITPPEEPNA